VTVRMPLKVVALTFGLLWMSASQISSDSLMHLSSSVTAAAASAAARLTASYPELNGLTVREIRAVYTAVPRPSPRPAVNPRFVCGSGRYSDSWTSGAPPNCTNTGTFYRAYTVADRAAAEAIVELPDRETGSTRLPTSAKPTATGFVYIEGWPGPRTSNSEGGLHYNAGSDMYTPYLASPGKPENDADWRISPDSIVYLRVGSDENPNDKATIPAADKGKSCSNGCVYLIVAASGGLCPPRSLCIDHELEISSGWKGNCCIFARMTSIARTQAFAFDGDFVFGPVTWRVPYTETEFEQQQYRYDGCGTQPSPRATTSPFPHPIPSPAGSPCQSAGFSNGGAQLYPSLQKYIKVSPGGPGAEAVTILNPSNR
jgi:hypothetical protein